MLRTRRRLAALTIAFVVLAVIAVPAAGAITFQVDSEYEGTEADTQAITTTVTISPNDTKINNLTVDVSQTGNGFVDFGSFSREIDPAASDAQITYRGNGVYFVDELEPGETISITFDVYPRTIKKSTLEVANVRVEYVQQGQQLEDERTVTADMTSSSHFRYQEAREELQRQQWLFYASLVVVGAGVLWIGIWVLRRFSGNDFEEEDSEDF